MKQKELPAIVGIIIVIGVGLGLMAIAYFNFKSISDLQKTGIKTEAIITHLAKKRMKDSKYDARVVFVTKEGDQRTAILSNYSSFSSDKGKVIEIYYDPADPSRIVSESDSYYTIFLILGAVFFVIGILILRQTRAKAMLISQGNRLMADISDITAYKGKSEAHNLFIIHATYTERGIKYTFYSQPVQFDPSPFLNTKVLVYVDPKNYGKYHVDAESLVNKQGRIA